MACLLLTACALPSRVDIVREQALPAAHYGPLADYAGRIRGRLDVGESAHWLLDRNKLALDARLALVDEAATSLDVQYFIWEDDATGHLLASRLLAAADRGVKVRLLIDDFAIASQRGDIVRLDAHPNIEVRTFNPWKTRGRRYMAALEFIVRPLALNRRMHNKTLIADNGFAIVGGRNIGDRYFGVYAPFVQNDLDVLVAGPVVASVSGSFDQYWNSDHAFPVGLFARDDRARLPVEGTRRFLAAAIADEAERLQSFPVAPADWAEFFEHLVDTMTKGRDRLFADSPEFEDPTAGRLYGDLKALIASARREVLISSPYLIPDEQFRELFRQLVARGVRVAVVTNSLSTNNHVIAHTGYQWWRRTLLKAGVQLYELRADAEALAEYVTPPVTPARLGLHTKAIVVDRQKAFIGSPNIDPRSLEVNTEIGVRSDGPELAGQLADLIERDMEPDNAWRVALDARGRLRWSTEGRELKHQPAQGFGQRVMKFLLTLLPLKKQA
ncbi:MAG TPA: phospholipase D family protein [Gammaproteobacteria bacterium]|nr:phospholipase D family protein [Gammaproteobacteria bacterium]